MLLVDAANVIGSRPTGWWRDRAGAFRAFLDEIRAALEAGRIEEPVTVVLEGAARRGAPAGSSEGLAILHAEGSGDEALLDVIAKASAPVVLVTADRELGRRARALGADIAGPGWFLDLLGSGR